MSHKRKHADLHQLRHEQIQRDQQYQHQIQVQQRQRGGQEDVSDQDDDEDDDDESDGGDEEELSEVEESEQSKLPHSHSKRAASISSSPSTASAAHPATSDSSSSPSAAFAQLSTAAAPSPSLLSSSPASPAADDYSTAATTASPSQPPSFPSSSASSVGSSPSTPPVRPLGSSSRKSRPNDWYCFQGCGKHYKKSSGRSIRRHALSCYRTHHPDECSGMSDVELHALLAVKQEDGEVQTGLRAWRLRQSRRQASELPQHERWECPNGCRQYYRSTSSKSIEKHSQTCSSKQQQQHEASMPQQPISSSSTHTSSSAMLSPPRLTKQDSGSSSATSSPLGRSLLSTSGAGDSSGLAVIPSPFPLVSQSLTPQQLAILQQHAQSEAALLALQQQQQQHHQLLAQPLSASSLPNLQQLQPPQPQHITLTAQQLMQLQHALYMQQQQLLAAGSSLPMPLSHVFLTASNPLSASLTQPPAVLPDGLIAASLHSVTQQPASFAFPSSFSTSSSSSSSAFMAPSQSTVAMRHFQQQLSAAGYLSSPFSAPLPLMPNSLSPNTALPFPLSSLPPQSSHSMLQPITSVSTSAHSLSASSTLLSAAQPTQQSSSMIGGMTSLLHAQPLSASVGLRSASFGPGTSSSVSTSLLPAFASLQSSSLNLNASFPTSTSSSPPLSASPLPVAAIQPMSFLAGAGGQSTAAPPPALTAINPSSPFVTLLRSPSSGAVAVAAPLSLSLPLTGVSSNAPVPLFFPNDAAAPSPSMQR